MNKNILNLPITIISSIILVVSCAKKEGCTNPNATNYDSTAEKDDGSCINSNNTNNGNNSTITDKDGNIYKTVTIGNQKWMAENLKTTKYNDGTTIPNVTEDEQWSKLSTGAWCNYDNDSRSGVIYGKLYNWYAVNTNKLCPTGWHVPTKAEWEELTIYLAVDGHINAEGKALKAISGWNNNGNGTDSYGFKGLPGGYRGGRGGSFGSIGNYGYWWSSSEDGADGAWARGLGYGSDGADRGSSSEKDGYSVRCLRD
jgi:uncharacterized protein (TIGR02145 family)